MLQLLIVGWLPDLLPLIRFDMFNNDYLNFQNPEIEGSILTEESKRLFLDYIKTLEKDSYLYHFSNSILENN